MLRQAFASTLMLVLLLGVAYPAVVTMVGQSLYPVQANGSLVLRDGRAVGSRLVAQRFDSDRYFHPRPSAAGEHGYDGRASGGFNQGPTSRALSDRLHETATRLRAGQPSTPLPVDLFTASASGLDPHITVEAARFQARRVAQARDVSTVRVNALIDAMTEGREMGILGQPRVNVLMLNLALDDGV